MKENNVKSKMTGGTKVLRIKDIQEQYKVSRPTIYKWIENGLPIMRVGRLVFIEEKDLKKFIKKGK